MEISLWAALVQLSKNCRVGRLRVIHIQARPCSQEDAFPSRPVQAGFGISLKKKKKILPVPGKGRSQ